MLYLFDYPFDPLFLQYFVVAKPAPMLGFPMKSRQVAVIDLPPIGQWGSGGRGFKSRRPDCRQEKARQRIPLSGFRDPRRSVASVHTGVRYCSEQYPSSPFADRTSAHSLLYLLSSVTSELWAALPTIG